MSQTSENVATYGTIALLATAAALSFMSFLNGRRQPASGAETGARLGAIVKEWRQYAASGHRLGNRSAPVVITEFSDFLCPFCGRSQATLRAIREKYGNQVAIAFHHWPQESLHPRAFDAAIASECAADQGAFERYHDRLFTLQDSIDSYSWAKLARQAGVTDTMEFNRCVSARRHADIIAGDARSAESLGGRGTPFFLVNDRAIPGALPMAVFDSVIHVVLAQQSR